MEVMIGLMSLGESALEQEWNHWAFGRTEGLWKSC